jgi:hypothetical protein
MICKEFAPCAGLYTCTCSCGPLRARECLERVDREELIGASARRLKDVVVVRNCTGSALTAPATFLSVCVNRLRVCWCPLERICIQTIIDAFVHEACHETHVGSYQRQRSYPWLRCGSFGQPRSHLQHEIHPSRTLDPGNNSNNPVRSCPTIGSSERRNDKRMSVVEGRISTSCLPRRQTPKGPVSSATPYFPYRPAPSCPALPLPSASLFFPA